MKLDKNTEKVILKGIRNGGSLRSVAYDAGVHHKTVQNVGKRHGIVTVRSLESNYQDFSVKGKRVYEGLWF